MARQASRSSRPQKRGKLALLGRTNEEALEKNGQAATEAVEGNARGTDEGLEEKASATASKADRRRRHYSVYVVFLRNPKGDGKAGYYVGMTGLPPEQRFANHKAGVKAARVVRRFGERLVPPLYEHLNPMTYREAVDAEPRLAQELKARGFQVFGGH